MFATNSLEHPGKHSPWYRLGGWVIYLYFIYHPLNNTQHDNTFAPKTKDDWTILNPRLNLFNQTCGVIPHEETAVRRRKRCTPAHLLATWPHPDACGVGGSGSVALFALLCSQDMSESRENDSPGQSSRLWFWEMQFIAISSVSSGFVGSSSCSLFLLSACNFGKCAGSCRSACDHVIVGIRDAIWASSFLKLSIYRPK